jgi:arginase
VVAGNCNVAAIGVAAGIERAAPSTTALLWFDAHDDCETPETTTSGFIDGMGLAILSGQCFSQLLCTVTGIRPVRGDHVVLIGAREISPGASDNLARAGIHRISIDSVRSSGSTAILESLRRLRANGVLQLVVHVDFDVLDPDAIAPANQYAVRHGLLGSEVIRIIDQACASFALVGASFASFDPAFDVDGRMLKSATNLISEICRRGTVSLK